MVVSRQPNDHFGRERPRVFTLVDPPWGGQTAIGVVQSDHEALQRDSLYEKELAFYLNRTTTLPRTSPRKHPGLPPLGEANLR